MDLVASIDQASEALTPVELNVNTPGPGGQSYDLAPTPKAEPVIPVEGGAIKALSHGADLIAKYPVAAVGLGVIVGISIGRALGRRM